MTPHTYFVDSQFDIIFCVTQKFREQLPRKPSSTNLRFVKVSIASAASYRWFHPGDSNEVYYPGKR